MVFGCRQTLTQTQTQTQTQPSCSCGPLQQCFVLLSRAVDWVRDFGAPPGPEVFGFAWVVCVAPHIQLVALCLHTLWRVELLLLLASGHPPLPPSARPTPQPTLNPLSGARYVPSLSCACRCPKHLEAPEAPSLPPRQACPMSVLAAQCAAVFARARSHRASAEKCGPAAAQQQPSTKGLPTSVTDWSQVAWML